MISEWLSAIFLLLGAFFMLVASLGVVRLKDFYLRMHAATKAPSLGILLMVIGLIIHFRTFWSALEGLLIIVFVFLTTPIGSHMVSRVAHDMKVDKDPRTVVDELEEDESTTAEE